MTFQKLAHSSFQYTFSQNTMVVEEGAWNFWNEATSPVHRNLLKGI